MPDLTPADPAYLRSIIAQALVRRRNGRRTQDYADVMAIAAAEPAAAGWRRGGGGGIPAPPAPPTAGGAPPPGRPRDGR